LVLLQEVLLWRGQAWAPVALLQPQLLELALRLEPVEHPARNLEFDSRG